MHTSRHLSRKIPGYNCALLGCYAANSGNSLPTFRDNYRFHYSLPNSLEERGTQLFRGESLKSCSSILLTLHQPDECGHLKKMKLIKYTAFSLEC